MPLLRHILAVLALCCAVASVRAGTTGGHSSFEFESGGHRLTVWYHQPSAAADAPVVFVIHGVGRNAEEYLADWIELSQKKGFLLVVPEFSKTEFPGEESFNSGNLFDAQGRPVPRAQWSYSMIEPLFDRVRKRFGNHSATYRIYGHSAGAQFVQRFLYFVPEARASRAVAANAGWYMLPDLAVKFPYGLQGTPADAAALRTAFGRDLVVLLGEADIDVNHHSLRHTPEADAQGLFRFARGQYFYSHAKAAAAALGFPFRWTLATAPGVAHVNKDMAPFALPHLFP